MIADSVERSTFPHGGFTFIEAMIVVAILGLVAAVAYPSYIEFLERGRRSDAMEALRNTALLQERFYGDKKYYAGNMGDLEVAATTAEGYYELTITPENIVDGLPHGYTLNANARGLQAGDIECATMRLDSDGNETPAECW